MFQSLQAIFWEAIYKAIHLYNKCCQRFAHKSIKRFVPHKILKLNLDAEYYNKEVKRLKVKVRRAYNRRKLCKHYQAELKRLSKKLLTVKRNALETFLSSVLQNESKSWSEFYRFVKRRKGKTPLEGHQGGLILARQCPGSLGTCNPDKTGLPELPTS
jgi:hypothetical protein